MTPIKIGIIGCGLAWERLHWPAYQKLSNKYKITACCDAELDKAVQAAQLVGLDKNKVYEDYETMLEQEDLEAVDIMVTIPENFTVSKYAAQQGVDIICEKPLAANLEEAQEYTKFPAKYGVEILIAENFRYNEENNILRDLVQNQEVGEIVYFISNFTTDFPQEMLGDTFGAKEWRQHPPFWGGRLLDGAIHNLAGLRHIFGSIDSLHALGKPEEADFVPYTTTNINLKFTSGVTGQFSYFPCGKETQRPLIGTRIFGTEGMIYLEERSAGVINIAYNNGGSEQISYTPNQGFYNELVNFHQALAGQESISVPPEIEVGDLKTVAAILESAAENKVVSVDETSLQPEFV